VFILTSYNTVYTALLSADQFAHAFAGETVIFF